MATMGRPRCSYSCLEASQPERDRLFLSTMGKVGARENNPPTLSDLDETSSHKSQSCTIDEHGCALAGVAAFQKQTTRAV